MSVPGKVFSLIVRFWIFDHADPASTSTHSLRSYTMSKEKTSIKASGRPTEPVEGGLADVGAGFGRTGTASMQEALNILGYGPCYHMREVFKDPNGAKKWDQVGLDKEKADWESIFYGYKSTMDFPAASYYNNYQKNTQTPR